MTVAIGDRIRSTRKDTIEGWTGTVIDPDSQALEYILEGEFVVQYDEDEPATHGFYERYSEEGINWERVTE